MNSKRLTERNTWFYQIEGRWECHYFLLKKTQIISDLSNLKIYLYILSTWAVLLIIMISFGLDYKIMWLSCLVDPNHNYPGLYKISTSLYNIGEILIAISFLRKRKKLLKQE